MPWRKNREFIEKIEYLLTISDQAIAIFTSTFARHLNGVHDGIFSFGVDSLRKYKSESSNCVDMLRVQLFSSSSPHLRDDLMILVHTISLIIEDLAHVLYYLRDHSLTSIKLAPAFTDLLINVEEVVRTTNSFCHLFLQKSRSRENLFSESERLTSDRSRCDTLVDHCIASLFKDSVEPQEKLELSRIASQLGNVTHRCQKLINHIEIITLSENE